ncbi:MAG: type II toxin-antitoxin system prevent-host-death family antitoxin [Pseudomonadota bacterium]
MEDKPVKRVSEDELVSDYEYHRGLVQRDPVMVTRAGEDDVVLLSAYHYRWLTTDVTREVRRIEDMSDAELAILEDF